MASSAIKSLIKSTAASEMLSERLGLFRAEIEFGGVEGALKFLNARTPFRYTAKLNFSPEQSQAFAKHLGRRGALDE